MSRPNRGKEFESRFAKDWKKAFPSTFILRLRDNTSGYKFNSKNPCDFICFPNDNLYLLEVKSHYKNRFPFSNLTQYDDLISYRNCKNIKIGVVIWFIDHDRIIFVDIDTIEKMKMDGLKSVNIRLIDKQGYKYTEIPSTKKRVYLESDYTILLYN